MARKRQKTHSGCKKRFRFTKTGKIKRDSTNRRHILNKKTTKRKRHLRKGKYVDKTNEKAVREMMPYQ